jgi:hypothetical protein
MTPMNEDQERAKFELILPRGMRAKLEARAAKRGLTPETLLDEVHDRIMAKPKALLCDLMIRARKIDDALMQDVPPPWPDSFDECLEVGLARAGLAQCDVDNYLPELEGMELTFMEAICKRFGIIPWEITPELIDLFLAEGQDDEDEGEEWKTS